VYPTSVADLEDWLHILEQIKAGATKQSTPDFLRPFHLLTFAIMVKTGRYKSFKMDLSLEGYANRMRLWDAVGLEPPAQIKAQSSKGRFCPITRIDRATAVPVTQHLASLFVQQMKDGLTHASLEIALLELLENCFMHAAIPRTPLTAFVAAQAWFNGNLAQIAIADDGIGIRTRLMNNPALREDLIFENACELATRYGITADPEHHSGYGLTFSRDLLTMHDGNLMVVSFDEMVCCNRRGVFSRKMRTPWKGTLILFEWKTKNPLDAEAVYNKWPKPKGFEDDDFL